MDGKQAVVQADFPRQPDKVYVEQGRLTGLGEEIIDRREQVTRRGDAVEHGRFGDEDGDVFHTAKISKHGKPTAETQRRGEDLPFANDKKTLRLSVSAVKLFLKQKMS